MPDDRRSEMLSAQALIVHWDDEKLGGFFIPKISPIIVAWDDEKLRGFKLEPISIPAESTSD